MACGRRLTRYGLLAAPDDVFFLNYYELEETLALLAENRIPALYHFKRLIPPLVKERKEGWEQVSLLKEAPLTMGKIPEKAEDPILVKVFGMVDEVLHAGKVEELKVMDIFEGYPGSPGIAEGIARVIMSFEEFPKTAVGRDPCLPLYGDRVDTLLSQDQSRGYRHRRHAHPCGHHGAGIRDPCGGRHVEGNPVDQRR